MLPKKPKIAFKISIIIFIPSLKICNSLFTYYRLFQKLMFSPQNTTLKA